MLLVCCGNVRVVAPVSRLKFFLTSSPMLVLCYHRNTPPNFAFAGILYYGMPVRWPLKILAILASLTPMATCITSQVALSQNRKIYSNFILKEPLASSASHAGHGDRVPGRRSYRPAGLPCFHAVLPGRSFSRWCRAVLNSGPFMLRRRRKTRISYFALSAQ